MHQLWNHRINQIEKGVRQGCTLSLYLLNIYTDYVMREVGEAVRLLARH